MRCAQGEPAPRKQIIMEMNMRKICNHTSSAAIGVADPVILERPAARGIILDGHDVLMIYTRRYNDYSFPGGGVDEGEDLVTGLLRELSEETGAKNVSVLETFGDYEEFRPSYYDGIDVIHMISRYYICSADRELGQAHPEDYEINNGSVPVWINIHEAIAHNEAVMNAREQSMGLSIDRETAVLKLIVQEYLPSAN